MSADQQTHLDWSAAAGMPPSGSAQADGPLGALVPDEMNRRDQVAVVYNKGEEPPEITVLDVSGTVQTVLANGVAVAILAQAAGPALSAEDILLVERAY